MKEKDNNNMRPPKRTGIMKSLFGKREVKDIFQEEQIQGPWRTVMKTFFSNKINIFSLGVFLIIALSLIIFPFFKPVVLSDQETTQQDMAPGRSMMKIPEGDYRVISQGKSFGMGLTEEGVINVWGNAKVGKLNLAEIPDEVKNAQIEDISVGFDHVLALDKDGKVYAWGNNRLRQTKLPPDVAKLENVKQVIAGLQISLIVTDDNRVKIWGNENSFDFRGNSEYQGKIEKIAAASDTLFGLTTQGEIVYLGRQTGYISTSAPEGKNFIDIVASAKSFAGITSDGGVYTWGNKTYRGEGTLPEEILGKPIKITSGRYHYTLLMEDGSIQSFGDNSLNQTKVPSGASSGVKDVFSGYYQNYAIKEDGSVLPWGLKGYLMGTDEFGRDLFTRLMNGGLMTLTIGTVAVIISTVIGVIVGGVSGYFGGTIDLVLQRISEMISSLPFLPFAMILNALIGNSMNPNERIYLMMVILGLLSWPNLQRLVRAQVLSVREQEFVVAAKSVGVKEGQIVFRHIIPNVISVIIVTTTLSFAGSMLTESSLSFLGFGVKPPIPTWGNMLYGANNSIIIQAYWWRWVFPSIALSLTVIAVNIIGDGLRDAIDPRSQDR